MELLGDGLARCVPVSICVLADLALHRPVKISLECGSLETSRREGRR